LSLLYSPEESDRHVIFIHGLRRVGQKPWTSGKPSILWPLWLADDVERLSIWSVEYDAAPTFWRGTSMARVDRANNVLARLLAEDSLKQGDLSFVVHSFGGLVFEQMLRSASERAGQDSRAAEFVKRISRVTFLGTPHRGADLATWGGRFALIFRRSNAARGLERNDPDLRDLNHFYRGYVSQTGLDTQCLVETRSIRLLGIIVKPDSGDVGLPTAPIPVDADHFEIAAPLSRSSEVYIHIREQLNKPINPRKSILIDTNVIETIAKDASTNSSTLAKIEEHLLRSSSLPSINTAIPRDLIDAETDKRIARLRRMRFFADSTHIEEAEQLARELLAGSFAEASVDTKIEALAWCVRMLLAKPDRSEALRILDEINRIKRTPTVSIAQAFAASYEGNTSDALKKLSEFNSNESRGASFIVVVIAKEKRDAWDWFTKAGLSTSTISSDGKFFLIKWQLDHVLWPEALATADSLNEEDYQQTGLHPVSKTLS
jgi:hypothetical protein